MPFLKGENPHRPPPESVLKVEPIRDKRAIGRIKKMLRDHPRDWGCKPKPAEFVQTGQIVNYSQSILAKIASKSSGFRFSRNA